MHRQIALPAALVLALAAAGLSAQQTTFRTKIELVNVDVVVVDKDGKAVRGLKASDFALTDRKKPQTIATFEEISHERGRAGAAATLPPTLHMDVASNTTVQADRLVMLLVDDLHIWQGRTDKTKTLARDLITRLGTEASMAVVFTSGEGSTEITQDRSRLLEAIEGMKGRQSFRRPHMELTPWTAYVDPEDPNYNVKKHDAVNTSQRASLQDNMDNLTYFRTIRDAAHVLVTEAQRRKAFVLISEGMMIGTAGIASGGPARVVDMGSADGSSNLLNTSVQGDMDEMMKALRNSNVALYAMDPRGKVRAEDMMLESWPPPDCAVCNNPPLLPLPTERFASREDLQDRRHNPVRVAQDGLTETAEAAGGFAITDSDDFTGGLNRILEDLDHYYLIGFYPDDPSGSNHPVSLTVPEHPEYTVRFRRGYTPEPPPPGKAKNKDPLNELALGVMPKSDLPLRLTAMPLAGLTKKASVVIALEVTAPVGLMKETDAKLRDDVTYQVIVVDEKKARVAQREGRAAKFSMVARDPSKPEPDAVTYQIPLTIELPPGRYQLRASAMSKKLDKGGSVYLDVMVPEFSKAPLTLSTIALGFADGSRVPVGRTRTRTVQAGPPRPGVVNPDEVTLPPAQARAENSVNLLPFEPTLSREFDHTDALGVFFTVARNDTKSTVALTISILGADNKALMAFDRSVGPNHPGGVVLRVPLDTLAPGAFVLRVAATDSRHVAKAETGFIVK